MRLERADRRKKRKKREQKRTNYSESEKKVKNNKEIIWKCCAKPFN